MTITRQGQLTAETRILTDVTYFADQTSVSSVQAKTGTYSYILGWGVGPFGISMPVVKTAVRIGYWQYLHSAEIVGVTLIYYGGPGNQWETDSPHVAVDISTATGLMRVIRPLNNTQWETLESVALPSVYSVAGSWFHVGITHKVHETAGFLSVYINGIQILEYTGDTRPSYWDSPDQLFTTNIKNVLSTGGAFTAGLQGYDSNNGCHIDDLFVDSYEDEDDAPVPSRRFYMVLPTGAGVDAEWTPLSSTNVSNVDENPNDGDATYNKALAADLRDTFVMGDIALPVDHQIVAVIPSPFVKRLDSEIASEISVHAWDGLIYGDSADIELSMSYDVPAFARLTTQPDNSDWNETDFNAMQFGYRSRGAF